MELQGRICEETGTKLHVTYTRMIMYEYDLSPKKSQRIHVNKAGKRQYGGVIPRQKTNSMPGKRRVCHSYGG